MLTSGKKMLIGSGEWRPRVGFGPAHQLIFNVAMVSVDKDLMCHGEMITC